MKEVERLKLKKNQELEKRIFDIIIAGIAIIILLPAYVLIAILIKTDSKGKVIFLQERVGKNGRIFKIYKFRTMIENAEQETGPTLEKRNDVRITKIGKILRKTKLDELPQFFNVLKGDMSIVGPRPERPYFANKIKEWYGEFEYREAFKPGITGLACIEFGYYANPEEKLKYDLYYMKNWNMQLDILICIKTIKLIIKNFRCINIPLFEKNKENT